MEDELQLCVSFHERMWLIVDLKKGGGDGQIGFSDTLVEWGIDRSLCPY